MQLPNIIYDKYLINSKSPSIETIIFKDNTYPWSYLVKDFIDQESLEQGQFKTVTVKNNNKFIRNKFLISIIFLQSNDIEDLLNLLPSEVIDLGITIVTKCKTFYPYCLNFNKCLAVLKLLLDKLKSLKITNFDEYLERYSKNAMTSNLFDFNAIRLNLKLNKCKFEGFEYIDNASEMIALLRNYGETSCDQACKYCLCSVPKNRLVRPCYCSAPVHIECFLSWKTIQKTNCEICGDSFSRINEKRMMTSLGDIGIDETIFFPFDDFYPALLIGSSGIVKIEPIKRFYYALCYLQCSMMKQLLKEAREQKIEPQFGNLLDCFRKGILPSNYSITFNREQYQEMTKILNEYGILKSVL